MQKYHTQLTQIFYFHLRKNYSVYFSRNNRIDIVKCSAISSAFELLNHLRFLNLNFRNRSVGCTVMYSGGQIVDIF